MRYSFTFLRHGESTGNQQQVIQGQSEYPLSEAGKNQIEQLANTWRSQEKSFDQIITSPLSRAVQTAKIIQSHFSVPLEVNDLWKERSAGELEGKPRKNKHGVVIHHTIRHLYEAPGETGESDWQLHLRAGEAIQSLLRNLPGNYLIVSHSGMLQQVLTIITGAKPEAGTNGFFFRLTNGAYVETVFDADDFTWEFHALIQSRPPRPSHKMEEDESRFLFVRHAQSEGNIQRLFQGQMETPLTELGIEQAQAAGAYFAAHQGLYNIQQIIASPQVRARQTAEAIAQPLGLKITYSDLLKEIHNGDMAGLTGAEINQLYPERLDHKSPYISLGQTGESWFELFLRGGQVVDMLAARPPACYLIVSHGAFLNAILWAAIGIAPRNGWRDSIFRFQNTAFTELTHSPGKRQWGMFQFVPPELRRIPNEKE